MDIHHIHCFHHFLSYLLDKKHNLDCTMYQKHKPHFLNWTWKHSPNTHHFHILHKGTCILSYTQTCRYLPRNEDRIHCNNRHSHLRSMKNILQDILHTYYLSTGILQYIQDNGWHYKGHNIHYNCLNTSHIHQSFWEYILPHIHSIWRCHWHHNQNIPVHINAYRLQIPLSNLSCRSYKRLCHLKNTPNMLSHISHKLH